MTEASLSTLFGSDLVQAVVSSTLPPVFLSNPEFLIEELRELHSLLPNPELAPEIRARIFDVPEFRETRREEEWRLSRSTLIQGVRQLLARGADPSEIKISLSHTQGMAAALGVASPDRFGVGCDLELRNRSISDAAFSRISRPEELTFSSERLEHWVLKEACFKAHPQHGTTIVADYEIFGRSLPDGAFEIRCRKGSAPRFRALLIKDASTLFAVARAVTT